MLEILQHSFIFSFLTGAVEELAEEDGQNSYTKATGEKDQNIRQNPSLQQDISYIHL